MIPLRVLGDRVLIKPDVNQNAPETTAGGIVLAASMAAAVTGEDKTTSLCRGTVIAVGHPKHPCEAEAYELAADVETYNNYPELVRAAELLRSLVHRDPCCAVGDDVLFSHDAGQQITLENETYLLMREAELLAIVEPEKELVHG